MGGLADADLERDARMLLARLGEGGDPRIGRRIAQRGAVEVVAEVVTRTTPFPALGTRLPDRLPSGELDVVLAELTQGDRCRAERCGARFIWPGESEWPTQLDDLGDRAPIGLWVMGASNLRLLALRSISMVGARAATAYGEGIARHMAAELADAGWLVVSGGAFGIDAAAHRGALDAGGATACVLAGGVDVPYPRSHAQLLARVCENGVLLSETPPGGAAMRQRFLTRNRIIAAVSRGTVVIEAALRSGSRTTAREAAALARHVMAVPGPVTSAMSAGCHELLRDQEAVLVTGTTDVLAQVGSLDVRVPEEPTAPRLRTREARVLDAVPVRRCAGLVALSQTAGLLQADVLSALGLLEARGLVRREAEGWRRCEGSHA